MTVTQSVGSDSLQPHGLYIQSTELSRPEYRSGQSLPSPGELPNPRMEPRSPALQADSSPSEPQGKPKNTGGDSLSLLQWIFPTQESNLGLLHCRRIPYQLSYQGMTISGRKRTSTVDSFKNWLYNLENYLSSFLTYWPVFSSTTWILTIGWEIIKSDLSRSVRWM